MTLEHCKGCGLLSEYTNDNYSLVNHLHSISFLKKKFIDVKACQCQQPQLQFFLLLQLQWYSKYSKRTLWYSIFNDNT